jgi:PAS domain-containing protein
MELTRQELLAEIADLKGRLAEAEGTLKALGRGTVAASDLAEQKRQEASIAEGKLSQEILLQAEQAVAVCDREARIILASRGLHELCGYNPLLLPFHIVFPLKLPSGQTFLLAPLFQGKPLRNIEANFVRPGGKKIEVLLNAGCYLKTERSRALWRS